MMIIINLLIFCLVLYIYVHIYNYNKTSNYLELYEMEHLSKEKLEDVMNFKQPLLLNNYMLVKNISIDQLLSDFSIFNLNIYNNQRDSFYKIPFYEYNKNINNNSSNNFLSYNNDEFLQETALDKMLSTSDFFFRPYNLCNKKYDIIMGSENNNTRLKYSINSRTLLYLSSGQIEITLCPPKYYKNLHVIKNYETLEFYSEINIYNVEPIYKNDLNKVKFLRVLLKIGQVLVIPPYWFYTIRFIEKNSIVFQNTYTTYINILSTVPQLCIQLLQIGNVKLNVIKKNYYKKEDKEQQQKPEDKKEDKEEDKAQQQKTEDKEEGKEEDKEEGKEEEQQQKPEDKEY